MARWRRTKAIPSTSWSTSSCSARPAASVARATSWSGRTAGSGRMASALSANIPATMK